MNGLGNFVIWLFPFLTFHFFNDFGVESCGFRKTSQVFLGVSKSFTLKSHNLCSLHHHTWAQFKKNTFHKFYDLLEVFKTYLKVCGKSSNVKLLF